MFLLCVNKAVVNGQGDMASYQSPRTRRSTPQLDVANSQRPLSNKPNTRRGDDSTAGRRRWMPRPINMDLFDPNCSFETHAEEHESAIEEERLRTASDRKTSADQRKSVNSDNVERQTPAAVVGSPSEQQTDSVADSSGLAGPRDRPPGNPEAAKKNTTGVKNQDEMPEIENRDAGEENTAEIENPNVSKEVEEVDSSSRDADQEAEGGEESQTAADETKEDQADVFVPLPPRSPYREPPVFKGHKNYGFEFLNWAVVDEPVEKTGDESKKSDNEDDKDD